MKYILKLDLVYFEIGFSFEIGFGFRESIH